MVNVVETVELTTATETPRLRQMARGLLDKTRARQANWVPAPNRNEPPEFPYRLVLPDSRLTLTYTRPRASEDFITLRFENASGGVVDEWRVDEPPVYTDEGQTLETQDVTGDWRLMKELFGEVHRQATGYDRVISDVEKALASLGVIGKPAQ